MRVRVLIEQSARRDNPDRHYLASGEEYDLDQKWAKELLDRGDAEPVAVKRSARAEKRGGSAPGEKR